MIDYKRINIFHVVEYYVTIIKGIIKGNAAKIMLGETGF